MKNKYYFPTELAFLNLKHPLLNCPALSIIVLEKLTYRLIEWVAVVQSSQKN